MSKTHKRLQSIEKMTPGVILAFIKVKSHFCLNSCVFLSFSNVSGCVHKQLMSFFFLFLMSVVVSTNS